MTVVNLDSDQNLDNVHTHERFVAETVYSGEPLPEEPTYPVKYIYTNGESVICYTRLDLTNAAQYDFQLTMYPSMIAVLGIIAAVAVALYLY